MEGRLCNSQVMNIRKLSLLFSLSCAFSQKKGKKNLWEKKCSDQENGLQALNLFDYSPLILDANVMSCHSYHDEFIFDKGKSGSNLNL